MKTYKVPVTRISYSSKWIEVTAENEEDAITKAKEKACDLVFDNEYDADYFADSVDEITNNQNEN